MDNPGKGGRGKQAPYKTVMCRVPEPLKPLVDEMGANYRELVSDYENPEDGQLIVAVMNAIAPGGVTEDNKRTQQLVREYEDLKLQIDKLNLQIEKLKSTNNRDTVSKALIDFIQSKKESHKKQWGDKKEFSLGTRTWDAFRDFIKFIQINSEELQSSSNRLKKN